MEMESCCRGAVRPCRPLSQCTQQLRAAFSMAVTAEVAVQEEEKEEVVKDAGVVSMRTFGRSWTIKPGLVTCVCLCSFTSINDRSNLLLSLNFTITLLSDTSGHGGGRLSCK